MVRSAEKNDGGDLLFRLFRVPALRIAAALSMLAAATATAVAAAPSATAIENGTSVTPAPPWAAYITVVQKEYFFWQKSHPDCTGTIVAEDWVLTAAHCVLQEDQHGNLTHTQFPASIFRVVLGRDNLRDTWQGGQWTVDKIVVDPDFSPDPQGPTGDVALMHLHGPLSSAALPLPLAPSGYNPADGQDVTAYGYGSLSEHYTPAAIKYQQWSNYTYTPAEELQETQPGSYTLQMSCTDAVDWCMRDNGPSQTLHGDSGGPWMPDPKNPFLIGVNSFASDPKVTSATTVQWQHDHPVRLTAPPIYKFVTSTANIPIPAADTIYRNSATGASWLAESDGFLHPIATGDTYLCLTGHGDKVENHGAFFLAELPKSTTDAKCSSFASGDLFAGVGNGLVAHYSAAGSFIGHLDTGTGSTYETGGCFAPGGEFYQTNFSGGSITKFSASGAVENSQWGKVSGTPESCVVASDGTVYVGNAAGSLDRFASDGTLEAVLSPQTEDRGIDWLSWGPGGCTLRYTSEGSTVFQYNVCTSSQEAPFATIAGGPCYENAPLADGGLLVACSSVVVRLDSSGNTVQGYPAPGSGSVFALAAAPSASSFYVGDLDGSSSAVYQVDLKTGATLRSFTPSPEVEIDGLTLAP